jgi:hypothetical protein
MKNYPKGSRKGRRELRKDAKRSLKGHSVVFNSHWIVIKEDIVGY